jgi:hypothetical protein
MDTGSDSSDLVEEIELDDSDVDEDNTLYEAWVRSCPYLSPIARAELLARAAGGFNIGPGAPRATREVQYWADQRPRIPTAPLYDLIANETHSSRVNDTTHNRGTLTMQNEMAPNSGTLHFHGFGVVHPFDQVLNTIVPVFTLGDKMIAWRESLPPRADDAAGTPESDGSAGDVGLAK